MEIRKYKSYIPYVVAGALLVIAVFGYLSIKQSHKEELAAAVAERRDSVAYYKGIAHESQAQVAELIAQDSARDAFVADLQRNINATVRTVYFPVSDSVKTGGPADSVIRLAVAEYRKRRNR